MRTQQSKLVMRIKNLAQGYAVFEQDLRLDLSWPYSWSHSFYLQLFGKRGIFTHFPLTEGVCPLSCLILCLSNRLSIAMSLINISPDFWSVDCYISFEIVLFVLLQSLVQNIPQICALLMKLVISLNNMWNVWWINKGN